MTLKKKEFSLKFQKEVFGMKVVANIFSLNSNTPECYKEMKEKPFKMVSAFVFLGTTYNYDGSFASSFLALKSSLMSHLNDPENHSQAVLETAVNISCIFCFSF